MSDEQQQVDRLLKDREKYFAWLKRLESEKTATTERAFARVREDYQRRLDEVDEQLRSHTAAVEAKVGQLQDETAELEARLSARSEELDEAQLRRTVGEYRDDGEWADLEQRLLAAVRECERELERSRMEIDRLEEILSLIKGAEARAAPQPAPPPPVAPPPPPAPPPQPAGVAEAADADEGFLSLEELVLEDKEPAEVLGPEPEPQQALPVVDTSADDSEPAPPAQGGAVTDELAFLESLSLGGGQEAGAAETDNFSFLEQHGSGTPQKIICTHCSAANDPAEWYCTECGEE
ncbi:MAG: hypothetical protein ACYTGC_19320, partial [Planctomycetota bacterium]